MSFSYSIGLSGLSVQQRLIDLAGQNIANAETPGYHRQVADLAVRVAGRDVGMGVEIERIRRVVDQSLENSLIANTSETGDVSARLTTLRRIESLFDVGTGSVHDLLERFFNSVEELAARPADITQRRLVLADGQALADALNAQQTGLQDIRTGVVAEMRRLVEEANLLAGRIADLNDSIRRTHLQNGNISNLADRRDALVARLSEIIDVRTVEQDFGEINVLAAGLPLVLGNKPTALEFSQVNGSVRLSARGLDVPLTAAGGSLAGLKDIHDLILPELQTRLDDFARTLIAQVDGIHAAGLGLAGPFTMLAGQRAVSNVGLPLAQAGLDFPPQAGTLTIGVTDQATGIRTLHTVALDPATQSLQDAAAAIDAAVPDLQAVVDTQAKTLVLVARPGFSFDFAGGLPTAPSTSTLSGTSVPTLSGSYSGQANEAFTFTIAGSGTVGVTPGLTLEARNAAGQLVATWNIGQGYEPGSSLEPHAGIRLALSTGTVNAGENFLVEAVAAPDTAGILPALGLNGFFVGARATLTVRTDLRQRPELLAAASTPQPGDGNNLLRLAQVRDRLLMSSGTETLRANIVRTAAEVGSRIQDLEQRSTALETLALNLEAQRAGISGVDPNEELVRLVQYQKAYQFSARHLQIVNETLQDLLLLV